MLEELKGENFCFIKGQKYKALDGDRFTSDKLSGKILVRQPNSPKKHNWWCAFEKSCIGKQIAIV